MPFVFSAAANQGWLPFGGGVYFVDKLTDSNNTLIRYMRGLQLCLIDAGSSTCMQSLSPAVSCGNEY